MRKSSRKDLRSSRVRLSGSGYSNLYRNGQLKQQKIKKIPRASKWITVQPEQQEKKDER